MLPQSNALATTALQTHCNTIANVAHQLRAIQITPGGYSTSYGMNSYLYASAFPPNRERVNTDEAVYETTNAVRGGVNILLTTAKGLGDLAAKDYQNHVGHLSIINDEDRINAFTSTAKENLTDFLKIMIDVFTEMLKAHDMLNQDDILRPLP